MNHSRARPRPIGSSLGLSRRSLLRVSWAGLMAGVVTGCQLRPPGTTATSGSAPKVERAPGEVIFSPPPTLSIPKATGSAQPLAQALSGASGLSVKVLVPSDASTALLWMGDGKIDVAWLWPLFYVKAKESLGAGLLLRVQEGGKTSESGLIVTRKDAGIQSLKDLKGKKIAATDAGDATGWIYPAAELKKAGVDPFEDVEVNFNDDSNSALISLLSKDKQGNYTVDAAFINEGSLGAKAVADKLKTTPDKITADTVVLNKTEGAPTSVLVTRSGLDSKTIDGLHKALLGLGDNQSILKPFGADGFADGKDSDFDSLRERAKAIGVPLTV